MISRGTIEENRRIAEEQPFDFPILMWEDETAGDYQVPGTPYLYLISGDQKIAFSGFAKDLDRIAGLISDEGG